MFLRLKDGYALRGWQDKPHALLGPGGLVETLDNITFQALSFCTGSVNVQSPLVLPVHRQILGQALEKGIVEACAEGASLHKKQRYHMYPSRYMRMAHWSVTGKCNYRCKHCFLSAPENTGEETTFEQCVHVVEQLAECGVTCLSLTGGECLVRSDFLPIVDKILEAGIHIATIYSNGKLVKEPLLRELRHRGIFPEFNMSYDGKGWHDWLRGMAGAEEAVLEAFSLCRSMGFPTSAEMCIHKGNAHTLLESIQILADAGLRSVKVVPVANMGMWEAYDQNYSLSCDEVYELYLSCIEELYRKGIPLDIMLSGFIEMTRGSLQYHLPATELNGPANAKQCICAHARQVIYISSEARVLPCMPLANSSMAGEFPSLLEMSLAQALNSSRYNSVLDTTLEEYLSHNADCRQCPDKFQCGGGCRANALLKAGDYFAKDEDICRLYKNGYREKIHAAVEKGARESTSRREVLEN